MPALTLSKPAQEDAVRPGSFTIVASALMAVGLVMVASTSASIDRSLLGASWLRAPHTRQCIFALVGIMAMLAISRVAGFILGSVSLRRTFTIALCVGTLLCLIATLFPGLSGTHHGSQRWLRFDVGPMTIGVQPSEFAKPALVFLLAWLLADRGVEPKQWRRGFLPAAVGIGVCVVLVGLEDFGTAALLAGVGAAMLIVAGCHVSHLLTVGGVGTLGLAGLLYAEPYRLERIAAYWDYWADPQGGGYQPLQSLATIASGSWLGSGLGSGTQKYGYLPESHTDFIFAVICEEMGVFGGVVVIALYAVFIWLGLRVMLAANSRFEGLIAFGLTAIVGLQACMNIAVVTVLAPTTGISLPLISAGGSGLIVFCLLTGVLMAVAIRGDARSLRGRADPSHSGIYG
jgi:cell division protein FtsW